MVLHLNKLESASPKDALCQVWLKLAKQFWIKKKMKFRQCLFAILFLSPIRTGQERFVPSLVEIGPVVLDKKMKCEKCSRQTTENWRSEKLN